MWDENEIEPHLILHTPMQKNDADAATIGEYLGLLLSTLWLQGEGFSSKRPFGNSSWETEIFEALGKAGFIEIEFDEDGYIETFDQREEDKGIELILQAIRFAYYHGA